MKTVIFYIRLTLLCLIVYCFYGCSHDPDREMKSLRSELERQFQLLEALQNYMQIVKVENGKGLFTIFFSSGESISLYSELTPILTVNEQGNWALNGKDTAIRAEEDGHGGYGKLVLEVGDNGNWFINGKDTKILSEISVNSTEGQEDYSPKILSIRLLDSAIVLYLSDATVLYVPINQDPMYVVPDYFMDQLLEKESLVRKRMETAGKDQASFVFFTDAHWGKNQKHSPAIIKHIVENTNISKVFFGGDVITSSCPSRESALEIGYAFQEAFGFLGPNFYCVYGNHDNNSNGQVGKVEIVLLDSQVYSYLQSQMTGPEIVYGNYFNFYFDQPIAKTRFIFVDTGRYFAQEYRSYCIPTVEFIVSSLTSVPEDWNIIMVGHIWNMMSITKVLDDYNVRKAGVYKFEEMSVSYDFTKANSRIVCCIGGHTHSDSVYLTGKGIPVMIMATDSQITNATISATGTIGEQCVSMIVADYQADSLFVYRVGRGEDYQVKMFETIP